MLRKEDFEVIGYAGRTHGVSGELSCKLNVELGELFESTDSLFLMVEEEGLLIPYRVMGLRSKSGDIDLIHFTGITTREEAEQLSGRNIWLSREYIADELQSSDPYEYSRYKGYFVYDSQAPDVCIGQIESVDDSTLNSLLYINRGDDELILPIAKELLASYHDEERKLYLHIPLGLLSDTPEAII